MVFLFAGLVLAEDHFALYKRQIESSEQFYARQAVENASAEHLYDLLRLALWNPNGDVRFWAAMELRKAPISEQARIWKDLLLDDGQWDWDNMHSSVNLTQSHIRDMMLADLQPYLGETDPRLIFDRRGRYGLVRRISEEILHEPISLPAVLDDPPQPLEEPGAIDEGEAEARPSRWILPTAIGAAALAAIWLACRRKNRTVRS
jgi:hypothetical protein